MSIDRENAWRISLDEYQDMRESSWRVQWIKRGRPHSYGIVSADAFLNRYRKYKKEHLDSVKKALKRGEKIPLSRFREYRYELQYPRTSIEVRKWYPYTERKQWYLERLNPIMRENPMTDRANARSEQSYLDGIVPRTGFAPNGIPYAN